MTPERYQEVKALFADVVNLAPEAREQTLKKAMVTDPDLVVEVRLLLDDLEEAGDFIEQPIIGSLDHIPHFREVESGDQIGPYQILRKLGEGGMGTVFLTREEEPVNRLVALKIIRPSLINPKVLARFDSERRALAKLNHPNIAAIYSAGATEEGLPYFAMEFVDGPHITDYCDQRRDTITRRIQLLLKVSSALEHTHRRNIIHRDIKPSNILVQETEQGPEPKIIDFGIVKATENTSTRVSLTTHSGLILGTLAYVSPEQAGVTDNPIEPNTDVYSLGIVLYELLTGVSPFDVSSEMPFHKTLERIGSDLPEPVVTFYARNDERAKDAASLRDSTPGDLFDELKPLDLIIERAVAKDPSQRYPNAADMSRDLQRFLDHQPLPQHTATKKQQEPTVRKANPLRWPLALAVVLLLALATQWWMSRIALDRWVEQKESVTEMRNLLAEAGALQPGPSITERRARLLDRYGVLRGEAPPGRFSELDGYALHFLLVTHQLEAASDLALNMPNDNAWVVALKGRAQGLMFYRAQRLADLETESDRLERIIAARQNYAVPALETLRRAQNMGHDGVVDLALLDVLAGNATRAKQRLEAHLAMPQTRADATLLAVDLERAQAHRAFERGDLDRANVALLSARIKLQGADRFKGDPRPFVQAAWCELLAARINQDRDGEQAAESLAMVRRLVTEALSIQDDHAEALALQAYLKKIP